MDAAVIEKEAMLLSETERALLADRLLASLNRQPFEARNAAWAAEVRDRMDAYERGLLKSVDGPSTLQALKARFKK